MGLITQTGFDPGTVISGQADELMSVLGTVVPAAIGVGIAVLGVRFGWRLLKSFGKG